MPLGPKAGGALSRLLVRSRDDHANPEPRRVRGWGAAGETAPPAAPKTRYIQTYFKPHGGPTMAQPEHRISFLGHQRESAPTDDPLPPGADPVTVHAEHLSV
jgi:hypothetical protein